MINQADNLYYRGQIDASSAMNRAASSSVDRMIVADGTNAIWSVDLRSWLQLQSARLALAQGKAATALELADATIQRLDKAQSSKSAVKLDFVLRAQVIAGDALARLGRRIEAKARWQAALNRISTNQASSQIAETRVQFAMLKRLGREREAALVAAELDRQGDRHPAYLREK